MAYDSNHQDGATATFVIVTVILLLLLFGMLVVGAGAIFFYRMSFAQREAVIAREQVLRAEAEARRQAQVRDPIVQEEVAQTVKESVLLPDRAPPAPSQRIQLDIDQAGVIRIDGQISDLQQLGERFLNSTSPSITLRVDPACEFRVLAPVIQFCKDSGVHDIEMEMHSSESP